MTLDPSAGKQERAAQKQLLGQLMSLLPCPTCRASYQTYCREMLPGCAHADLGDYVCRVHDKVNLKLEKEACHRDAEYWKRARIHEFQQAGWSDASFVEDMFYFLFAVAYNYPHHCGTDTHVSRKYREFFTTLPRALAHRPVGKCIQRYVEAHPLEACDRLANRKNLLTWLYGMYVQCGESMNQIIPLEEIIVAMKAIRGPLAHPP